VPDAPAPRSAVNAADSVIDSHQAFSFFQLVCERLSHPAYCRVDHDVFQALSHRVEAESVRNVEEGLSSFETLLTRSRDDSAALHAFRAGLIKALLSLSVTSPKKLSALHNHDFAATDIIPDSPAIAESYVGSKGHNQFSVAKDVTRWLVASKKRVDWLAFARLAVTLAPNLDDAIIVSETFAHLTSDEAQKLLDGVSSPMLDERSVRHGIEEQLAAKYPSAVRQWAAPLCDTSEAAARIAGATFDLSRSGLSELLEDKTFTVQGQIAVAADIILRVSKTSTPDWLEDFARERPTMFVNLLKSGADGNVIAISALARLLSVTSLISPEFIVTTVDFLQPIPASSLLDGLCALIVKSTLVWILRGRLEIDAFDRIAVSPQIANWVHGADGSWLAGILASEAYQEKSASSRAWAWLAIAPEPFYTSTGALTVRLVSQLCQRSSGIWSNYNKVALDWRDVLERANRFCDARISLRHSAQALEFAFGHRNLPLAAVVRSAFPTAYRAVTEGSSFVEEVNNLFSYDWDRAKALRRNLIEAFYHSDWAPADLALTAMNSFGLRKMFKRIWRKWHGEEYVDHMTRDLGSRDDLEALACKQELASLVANPNFYEAWD
jgi:hypothetical protein